MPLPPRRNVNTEAMKPGKKTTYRVIRLCGLLGTSRARQKADPRFSRAGVRGGGEMAAHGSRHLEWCRYPKLRPWRRCTSLNILTLLNGVFYMGEFLHGGKFYPNLSLT